MSVVSRLLLHLLFITKKCNISQFFVTRIILHCTIYLNFLFTTAKQCRLLINSSMSDAHTPPLVKNTNTAKGSYFLYCV